MAGRVIASIGKGAAWLVLALVMITFTVVSFRKGFNMGWIWLQESVMYLHAAVFMLAIAWTFQEDGHVRVDIFYREASPARRALVNIIGTFLFLIPFCLFLLFIAWEYVFASWQLLEGSREAGGLPAVYLLKSLILIMPALLLLQALASLPSQLRLLRSREATGAMHEA